jgi:hypothetical protein
MLRAAVSELTRRMTARRFLLGEREDLLELLPQAACLGVLGAGADGPEGLEAQELVARDLEHLGELDDDGGGRVLVNRWMTCSVARLQIHQSRVAAVTVSARWPIEVIQGAASGRTAVTTAPLSVCIVCRLPLRSGWARTPTDTGA